MANFQGFLLRLALAGFCLALFYPYLSLRLRALSLLLANSPDRLTEVNTFAEYSVKFSDRIRNCEDALIVEEDGVAILSCDPGRDLWNTVMGTFTQSLSVIPPGQLLLYRHGSPDLSDDTANALTPVELLDFPGVKGFHPLGIEYHRPSSTLFVCNHHYEGSRVEVFSLDLDSPRPVARHTRTITSPLIKSPNAIAALNGHEFYVTNNHYFLIRDHPWLAKLETFTGFPGGSLVYVNLLATTAEKITSTISQPVAHIPFANGVTFLNSSTLAVASTSTSRVLLYDILPDRSLQKSGMFQVPFFPDNLSTDKKGTLLIAGHPHPPSLNSLRKNRLECIQGESGGLDKCHSRRKTSPSWVAEWTVDEGLGTMYLTNGEYGEYGSSASAVKDTDRQVGIVTGLYADGILVWKE